MSSGNHRYEDTINTNKDKETKEAQNTVQPSVLKLCRVHVDKLQLHKSLLSKFRQHPSSALMQSEESRGELQDVQGQGRSVDRTGGGDSGVGSGKEESREVARIEEVCRGEISVLQVSLQDWYIDLRA